MQLKIKIDEKTSPKNYDVNLQKWEGEGGHNADAARQDQLTQAPLKKGQQFEVLSAKTTMEEGQKYQVVEVKPLEMDKRY